MVATKPHGSSFGHYGYEKYEYTLFIRSKPELSKEKTYSLTDDHVNKLSEDVVMGNNKIIFKNRLEFDLIKLTRDSHVTIFSMVTCGS